MSATPAPNRSGRPPGQEYVIMPSAFGVTAWYVGADGQMERGPSGHKEPALRNKLTRWGHKEIGLHEINLASVTQAALITEAEARLGMQADTYALRDLSDGTERFVLWFAKGTAVTVPTPGAPYVVLSAETLAGLLALGLRPPSSSRNDSSGRRQSARRRRRRECRPFFKRSKKGRHDDPPR